MSTQTNKTLSRQLAKKLEDSTMIDETGVEQPTKAFIKGFCKQMNIPFTKKMAMAVIYGDSDDSPDRILPIWLRQMKDK